MKKYKIKTEKNEDISDYCFTFKPLKCHNCEFRKQTSKLSLYFHCRLSLIFSIIGHSKAPKGRGYLCQ